MALNTCSWLSGVMGNSSGLILLRPRCADSHPGAKSASLCKRKAAIRQNTGGPGEGCALDSRDKPAPTETAPLVRRVMYLWERACPAKAPGTDFERPKEPPP